MNARLQFVGRSVAILVTLSAVLALEGCGRPAATNSGSAAEPGAVQALRRFVNNQSAASQIAGAQAEADRKLEDQQRAAAAISAANREVINQQLNRQGQAQLQAAAERAAAEKKAKAGAAEVAPASGDLSEFTFGNASKVP